MSFLCNSFSNKITRLQSIDKFTENNVFDKDISQQTFVDLQDLLKTSSVQQFLVFQDIVKTSWKTRNCYDIKNIFLIRVKEIIIIIILRTSSP